MTIKQLDSNAISSVFGGEKNNDNGNAWGWLTGGFGAVDRNKLEEYEVGNGIIVGNCVAHYALTNENGNVNPGDIALAVITNNGCDIYLPS